MNKKGFTLIELLITVAIIGILAAIAIPSYIGQQRNAARTEAHANLQNLRLLEEQFMAERGRYTANLGVAGKDHPLNSYDPADANMRGIIQLGGSPADPNNALPGFKPGTGLQFSYWIVTNQRFPINTAATPPTGTNVPAGDPPCFVAFAQGNTATRVDGEIFAIDCNNSKNF